MTPEPCNQNRWIIIRKHDDKKMGIRLVKSLGFILSGSCVEVFRGDEYPYHVYSLYMK